MADQQIDDKASDTLVVGLRLNALDEEFDPPPSPPNEFLDAPFADGAFFIASACKERASA
jgi:hypothetical protein